MLEPRGNELVPIASMIKESMLRKSSRQIIPWQWFEIEEEVHIVTQYDDVEPKLVQEALNCPVKDEWIKVMEDELKSIRNNRVWDFVDLPSNRKAIRNKWVLTIYKMKGR